MNWVYSAQDMDYCRALVNAVLNLRVADTMKLVNFRSHYIVLYLSDTVYGISPSYLYINAFLYYYYNYLNYYIVSYLYITPTPRYALVYS